MDLTDSKDLTFSEEINPILSMVSEAFRRAIERVPKELLELKEDEIIQKAYKKRNPPEVDYYLRHNLWEEYKRALSKNTQMVNAKIYGDVCNSQSFELMYRNPLRLAYVLCPFPREIKKRRYIIDMGWKRLKTIMQMRPQINAKTGLPDTKILELQTKIMMFMYEHENGKPTETVNQNTKNLNVNINTDTPEQLTPEQLTPEQLDEKIALLEAKSKDQLQIPATVLPVERVVQEAGRVSEEFKR